MLSARISRRVVAECIGTAFLVAVVVGSGIMGQRLSSGNEAIALLANTLATGAGLFVLILVIGPISGAHLNPVVTLAMAWQKHISWRDSCFYVPGQLVGGIVGTLMAHAMFGESLVTFSLHARSGGAQLFSEAVATFGLLVVIRSVSRSRPDAVPVAVASFIMAAYWFTASTSFANPAVTVARSLTDTFAGIRPRDVPGFVVAQIVGGFFGVLATLRLYAETEDKGKSQ